MITTSRHSKNRVKQRLGLSKKMTKELAEKALENGITHAEATGNLNKYITKLYFKNKQANNIRVYNQKVYIFNNNSLITILNLPNNLKKLEQGIYKKRE